MNLLSSNIHPKYGCVGQECDNAFWKSQLEKDYVDVNSTLRNQNLINYYKVYKYICKNEEHIFINDRIVYNYYPEETEPNPTICDVLRILTASKKFPKQEISTIYAQRLIMCGLDESVKILLDQKLFDPSNRPDYVLLAVSYHQSAVLKILLEDSRSDPTWPNDEPLRIATESSHPESEAILELLLEDPRIKI